MQSIDRYTLHERIGVGRISNVYRATDTVTNNTVALKLFKSAFVRGIKSVEALEFELEKRLPLSHPQIVRILTKGRYIDREVAPYLALEYVEGRTLSHRISELRERPFSVRQLVTLLLQVADALGCLHSKQIPLTSLDPRHILLTPGDEIKLPAFAFTTTRRWSRCGDRRCEIYSADPRYVAPEMISEVGIVPGDYASDVYLLGLLGFELGCGVPPFDGHSAIVRDIQKTASVPHTLADCNLPAWYESLIKRCLEKNPEDRPSLSEISCFLKDNVRNAGDELESSPNCIASAGIRVLFVEDNMLDQLSVARYAKSNGYHFTIENADTVVKARSRMSKGNIDVIVSDYLLPDGTASDIITAFPRTPVIVVTGTGRSEIVTKVLEQGAYSCIQKDKDRRHLGDLPQLVSSAMNYSQAIAQRDALARKLESVMEDEIRNSLALTMQNQQRARANIGDAVELERSLLGVESALTNLELLLNELFKQVLHEPTDEQTQDPAVAQASF